MSVRTWRFTTSFGPLCGRCDRSCSRTHASSPSLRDPYAPPCAVLFRGRMIHLPLLTWALGCHQSRGVTVSPALQNADAFCLVLPCFARAFPRYSGPNYGGCAPSFSAFFCDTISIEHPKARPFKVSTKRKWMERWSTKLKADRPALRTTCWCVSASKVSLSTIVFRFSSSPLPAEHPEI